MQVLKRTVLVALLFRRTGAYVVDDAQPRRGTFDAGPDERPVAVFKYQSVCNGTKLRVTSSDASARFRIDAGSRPDVSVRGGVFESLYRLVIDVTLYASCANGCAGSDYSATFSRVTQCEVVVPQTWPLPATPLPVPFAYEASSRLPNAAVLLPVESWCPGDTVRLWVSPDTESDITWTVKTGSVGMSAWRLLSRSANELFMQFSLPVCVPSGPTAGYWSGTWPSPTFAAGASCRGCSGALYAAVSSLTNARGIATTWCSATPCWLPAQQCEDAKVSLVGASASTAVNWTQSLEQLVDSTGHGQVFFQASCNQTFGNASNLDVRIIGGRFSPEGTNTFVASLQSPVGYHICGSALVAPKWLLTAAHCMPDLELGPAWARFGTSTQRGAPIPVVSGISHPMYPRGGDVALVKLLYAPLGVQILKNAPHRLGQQSLVLGWGQTAIGSLQSNLLREAYMTPTADGACPGTVGPDQFCAQNATESTCMGDSGGPLVDAASGLQVGVVSRGSACGVVNATVFTDPHLYDDWIVAVIANDTGTFEFDMAPPALAPSPAPEAPPDAEAQTTVQEPIQAAYWVLMTSFACGAAASIQAFTMGPTSSS